MVFLYPVTVLGNISDQWVLFELDDAQTWMGTATAIQVDDYTVIFEVNSDNTSCIAFMLTTMQHSLSSENPLPYGDPVSIP